MDDVLVRILPCGGLFNWEVRSYVDGKVYCVQYFNSLRAAKRRKKKIEKILRGD